MPFVESATLLTAAYHGHYAVSDGSTTGTAAGSSSAAVASCRTRTKTYAEPPRDAEKSPLNETCGSQAHEGLAANAVR